MRILPNDIAIIDGDTHISRWVQESGRLDHDRSTLPLLTPYLPKGGTAVDIGAFIGDHTLHYARQVGPTGTVVAFEPNPEAFACLAHNMQGLPHVTCINAAVGDTSGRIGIEASPNAGASRATAGEDIPVVTLDSLYLAHVTFMKLDCEGYEVRALRGAMQTIRHHRPVMLIEINEGALAAQGFTPGHIFDILDDHGYQWRNVYPGQPMSGPQYDILCTTSK